MKISDDINHNKILQLKKISNKVLVEKYIKIKLILEKYWLETLPFSGF